MSSCTDGCVYMRGIPGDCHISCANPEAKPERKTWPGCGVYPITFDACTVQTCDGFKAKEE